MSQIQKLTASSGPGSGTVTSISQGTGITLTPNPITTTGTVALTIPVAIANGGTNATSMTNTDGVVYYDGTRLVTTAVGTATHVLTSNGVGMAPTFQAAAGGVSGPGSSTDRAIATWNGAGGSALFNNSTTKITSAGIFTNSGQPAFQAFLSASDTNASGDGTTFVIGSGNALTIVFDQASNFTTAGLFTAPVTGIYCFWLIVFTTGSAAAGVTTWQPIINTTSGGFNLAYQSGIANVAAGGFLAGNGSITCAMTAGDTCDFRFIGTGGTKTVTINGGSNGLTCMGGYLVC